MPLQMRNFVSFQSKNFYAYATGHHQKFSSYSGCDPNNLAIWLYFLDINKSNHAECDHLLHAGMIAFKWHGFCLYMYMY